MAFKVLSNIFTIIGILATLIALIAYFYGGEVNVQLGKKGNSDNNSVSTKNINYPHKKEILNQLHPADIMINCKSKEKESGTLNINIINNLKWLNNTLNLDKLHCEMDNIKLYKGNPSRGFIETILFTKKQLYCIETIFYDLDNNHFNSAYHEICDFIDNCQSTITDPVPVNMHEKILLKLAINEFFKKYEENK